MSFSTTASGFAKRAPRKQTLNLLICGPDGTGKSSFINTLVGKRVLFEAESQAVPITPKSLRFTPTTVELDEPLSDGSRLVLTLVETEGFGLNIEHQSDIAEVAEFIESRFDEVLAEESRIRRNPRFKDNRIDACLYFIEPTGHGLRELDVLTLKRLATIVNVIPVLARSDSLTPSERNLNKRLVVEDLRFHDIDVFDFQYADESQDAAATAANDDNELFNALPFAVITTSEYGDNGESLFVRTLSYGKAEVLDPRHCDFKLLREALLDTFLTELKDRTHDVLYETFRTDRLDPQKNHRTSLLLPQELADHAARLKQAQIDRETARLREEERRVNAEIEAKRAMLLKRERELRELEQRMAAEQNQQQQHQRPLSQTMSSQPTTASSASFPVDYLPTTGSTHPAHNRLSDAERSSRTSSEVVTSPYLADDMETPNESPMNRQDEPAAFHSTSSLPHEGYVDGPVAEEPVNGEDQDAATRRVRQVRSKKELREHAHKLHAEIGDLEAQKESIQRQVASASTRSLHTQLITQDISVSTRGNDQVITETTTAATASVGGEVNTSPLNIKKASAE